MLKRTFIIFILVLLSISTYGQAISRVEPPCWWTGMERDLQLMIYGSGISDALVTVNSDKIRIREIHKADSPNFLFVDIEIDKDLAPGDYIFSLNTNQKRKKPLEFSYNIGKRAENSANRDSFGPADMVYLLMPDRFANGDPANDSHVDAVEKGDRNSLGGRHGGDIQGMIDHLDYMYQLGVTAIWPTPLLFDNEKSASYHGYACADYYLIDPRYGTNELYKQFVGEADKRGIKIIMDMVVNHCGTAHWWMKDLPFEDWINRFDSYTNSNFALSTQSDPYASHSDRELCVTGWFDTTMPDMNLRNPFVLNYFTQWAIWWIEWAGLGGLRVDTFPYSDKDRVAEWVESILIEYPNLTIVGECWMGTSTEISYWEGAKKNRDGYTSNLPMVMDFLLMDNIVRGFNEDTTVPAWGEGLRRIYNSVSQDFEYANPYNLMIFSGNHDTNRLAHLLKGDLNKQKMVMTLLSTIRGVPQLYVGDELMFRNKDGLTGHQEERIDFPGGWREDEVTLFEESGRDGEQKEIFDHTRKLFQWRKGNETIHKGKMRHFLPIDNVYVYFRYLDDKMVMTVINNGQSDYRIDWNRFDEMKDLSPFNREGKEVVTGNVVKWGEEAVVGRQLSIVVEF